MAGRNDSPVGELLSKLDWVEPVLATPLPFPLAQHVDQAADDDLDAAKADEERQLSELEASIVQMEAQLAAEDEELAQITREQEEVAAALAAADAAHVDVDAQLQQHNRVEARQQASAKLLQLQLTVATQLYGVAESLSHVAAAGYTGSRTGSGKDDLRRGGCAADALRHRDREVEELRRALKRQQQLVADAHRQLLELSTRRRPLGAAGVSDGIDALRAALAEQEMRRLMAEARCDELQAQVRLFEEQGLRLRLHPPPPATHLPTDAELPLPTAVGSPDAAPPRVVGVDLLNTPGIE